MGDGFRYYIGPEYGPAETYAGKSDEFMWLLQPTTKIARFIEQEARAICPVHGTRVRDLDPWCPYNIDPIEHPYKIQCMLGGEWYPSNDYASGDLTSGEYPDDGNGCRIDGRTYYFLREYAHMAYGSAVIPALRSLSQAYALTGDARYGRKGTILLARLASEYPNHDDRQDRRFYALYNGRDPRRQWITGGMITDHIWETFCLEGAVYAYDGLYRVIGTDQEGNFIWMSLNDSALLARGQVVAVEDSRLQLDSYLTFARRRPIRDGELVPGPDYYAGAWITRENEQFQVAGAVQDDENENERNTIYLHEPVDARKLRTLEHQSVSIWQYGVGDQLELALIEE